MAELALGENNLSGGFPADVALLTFLLELDFSSNPNLLGPLPSSLGNLEFLTIFRVNLCSFQETLPEEIGSWTRLEEFHVNTNFFSGTLPSSIGQWTDLRVFQVGGKFLNGILPWSLFVPLTDRLLIHYPQITCSMEACLNPCLSGLP